MSRPEYTCPGCGKEIAKPSRIDEPDGWLLADAWCSACGGTAEGHRPIYSGPRWYARVEDVFNRISAMPLVLEADSIADIYNQAYYGAEACAMEPEGDSPEVIEKEAARRAALAIAILSYGVEFIQTGPPETLYGIEADYNKKDDANTVITGMRKIYVVAYRRKAPGSEVEELKWSESGFDAADRYVDQAIFYSPDYESCQFEMEVPAAWTEELITSWIDGRVWASWPGDDDRIIETQKFFHDLRAGEFDAVSEAIYLIRTHALPEDHPLALD